MGRPSLDREEYEALAKRQDLKLVARILPSGVKFKTFWQCIHCGKQHFISYHKLKYKDHGCDCQNGRCNPMEVYHSLESDLGIRMNNFGYQPRNVNQKISWINGDGETFEASYHELRYGKIPSRLRQFVQNP